MTDETRIAWIAAEVPGEAWTNYPPAFAPMVAGRSKRRLGRLFGLESFGVNLTTLAPGARSALRHRHTVQDEFVYILSGDVMLCHDLGETLLRAGMCAGFRHGGTAHCLVNRSQVPASYLEVGDRRPGDAVDYPDEDLVAVADGDGWRFTHRDGTPW